MSDYRHSQPARDDRPGPRLGEGADADLSRLPPSRLFEEAHRTCPGCSAAMQDRGCKLRCPRCGFFLDCSDG